MPPGWVLLNRCVDYSLDDDEPPPPAAALEAEAAAVRSAWGAKEAASVPFTRYPTLAMLTTLKPAAAVAALPPPPEVATYTVRASTSRSRRASLSSAPFSIACADEGLLVLYAGSYSGPGSFSSCGCYLIHDAAADDDPSASSFLSTVPPPPPETQPYFGDDRTEGIGRGAVVRRCHHHHHSGGRSSSSGSTGCCYLLAELAMMPCRRFPDPDAALLLWRSRPDGDEHPQWVRKEVHLPREARREPGDGKHAFYSATAFAGPGGGCLCWVDLMHGIVVCAAANPHADDDDPDPVLRFIPLPDGCPAVSWSDTPYRPRMVETRSAACVGGRIRVVAMVGDLLEGWNEEQYRLTTWTLLPSSPDDDPADLITGGGGGWRWEEDGAFPLEDLWATEEYRALGLPPQTPLCPVLSPREDGVVYAVVCDLEERQFVLGIDVRRRVVSSSSGVPPEIMLQPRLFPFDFCSSSLMHGGAKNRQREVEASQVGDNGKRLKV